MTSPGLRLLVIGWSLWVMMASVWFGTFPRVLTNADRGGGPCCPAHTST